MLRCDPLGQNWRVFLGRKQRAAPKDFLCGKDVSAPLPLHFGKSLIDRRVIQCPAMYFVKVPVPRDILRCNKPSVNN